MTSADAATFLPRRRTIEFHSQQESDEHEGERVRFADIETPFQSAMDRGVALRDKPDAVWGRMQVRTNQ